MELTINYVHARSVKSPDPERAYLLQLRVYYGENRYARLPFKLRPREWDDALQRVTRHHPLHLQYNAILSDWKLTAQRVALDLQAQGRLTAERLRDEVLAEKAPDRVGRDRHGEVLAYLQEAYERIMVEKRALAESTLKQHRTMFTYLERYAPRLRFREINYTWLDGFHSWLLRQENQRRTGKTLSRNYIYALLAILSDYLDQAIRDGRLRTNELSLVERRRTKTEPDYLDMEEVQAVRTLTVHDEMTQLVQESFVFACCTSLRISDLLDLRPEHFRQDTYGLSLTMTPQKTGSRTAGRYTVPVDQVFDGLPGQIIRPYLEKAGPGERLFPVHVTTYRKHLKMLGRDAGLKRPLKPHAARHSFGMIMLNEFGYDLEDIKDMMGHTSIETTRVYARTRYRRIVRIAHSKFQAQKKADG